MTILLMVTGFSLVLVYNNLLSTALAHNSCAYSCSSNSRGTNDHLTIVYS